jgi:pyruvate,water dikinase
MKDLDQVGGKNSSLGELINGLSSAGVRVPGGFATTADAFREFLNYNKLEDKISQLTENLDTDDVVELSKVGSAVRDFILEAKFQPELEKAIREAYETLIDSHNGDATFAVRSSATAEDLPEASFAGQQETFLNIHGIDNILSAIKLVFASLYNDRAIAYRVHHGFIHSDVALSAGVQQMIRSDKAVSGVMFSVDTESGFDQAVFITSSYGLGEAVVQGAVNPDEFYVYKPALKAGKKAILKRGKGEKAIKMVYTANKSVGKTTEFVAVTEGERAQFSLTDQEVTTLARYAVAIEAHYGRPMDIEWAKDGLDGNLYILQARPETVTSRKTGGVIERYVIHGTGKVKSEGRAIGQKIGKGAVRVMASIDQMSQFQAGDVLVADMTDPDWEPIMKKASAIVTNRGGRTCHAAIIARELGIPAVVGTSDATTALANGDEVTVSCAEGETGKVYEGLIDFEVLSSDAGNMPEIPVQIMMNVGTPDQAFSFAKIPNKGVGLARMEFIINRQIGIHPNALLNLSDQDDFTKREIEKRITGYSSPREFYVSRLAEGMSMIAAAFNPSPVIFRLSDFKSNEYANLIGGSKYEPHEENPMLGFRGASRYISKDFREAFEMECDAVKRVRNEMGLSNLKVMIPFVRTVNEAKQVIELLKANGLERGVDGLQVIMMCELPSNALLADQFLEHFDGFSIGSNDLTQLTLGLDRDSSLVAHEFDERNDAVKALLTLAIAACKKAGKYVGICGQGPSDHPDLAAWLVDQGIDSVSLNPDTVVDTWLVLAKK